MTNSFHCIIIHGSVRNFERQSFQRFFIYCITVVLRSDVHSSRQKIFNRLVGTAMTEFQFIRIGTECQR